MKRREYKKKKNLQFTADSLQAAMEVLTEMWPKLMVTVLVGPFDAGICNYASNGDRENMIKALRETADRLENNEDNTRG